MRYYSIAAALFVALSVSAQCDRWQQHITCDLIVDLDVKSHRFTGTEVLRYQNNSPDTLRELFFHLYLNAFNPGSQTAARPDPIADTRFMMMTNWFHMVEPHFSCGMIDLWLAKTPKAFSRNSNT